MEKKFTKSPLTMVKLTDFIIRLSTLIKKEPLDRTLIDGRLSELSFSSWSITSEVMPGSGERETGG